MIRMDANTRRKLEKETRLVGYMLIRRFYMSFPRGRFLKFLLFCERLIALIF